MAAPYVFDTNVISGLRSYFPKSFPSLWERLDGPVADGSILSVREVRRELEEAITLPEWLQAWVKQHTHLFVTPGAVETKFVTAIFAVPHFQALVESKAILRGTPSADPFVIAAAHARSGTVVTLERAKPNAPKIPNVCEHFGVPCLDFEVFLHENGWSF